MKDLKGWEMQAIVDFMYKGEISVEREQLASFMNTAESLQVIFPFIRTITKFSQL